MDGHAGDPEDVSWVWELFQKAGDSEVLWAYLGKVVFEGCEQDGN